MLARMMGTARTEQTTVATAVDGETATAEEAAETSSSSDTIGIEAWRWEAQDGGLSQLNRREKQDGG
jgi:hypothetical protein